MQWVIYVITNILQIIHLSHWVAYHCKVKILHCLDTISHKCIQEQQSTSVILSDFLHNSLHGGKSKQMSYQSLLLTHNTLALFYKMLLHFPEKKVDQPTVSQMQDFFLR